MVLHRSCSAPRPWSGSTEDMISSWNEVCVYLGDEHPSLLSWAGNNTRVLCCILRSHRLYSQPDCSLYSTLCCCRYYCYSFRFSFLSHSFTVNRYARSLTFTRPLTPYSPYTHTLRILHKGLCLSYNSGNCRCRRPINRT